MKIITIFIYLVLFLASFTSCTKKSTYQINGSTTQTRLEGAKIFLVPMDTNIIKERGVDSAIINNLKFQFEGDKEFLARIVIDYHVRFGVQDLLVITEPGETTILIDSISNSKGTPQNDALQLWKETKMNFDSDKRKFMYLIKKLQKEGDTVRANRLKDSVRINEEMFRSMTLDIADTFGKSTLSEFFYKLYPKRIIDN